MAVMALDQGDAIALALLACGWVVLVWMWWLLVFRKPKQEPKTETECLWCYDDFRVEWMRAYPDETPPPYEPDFNPTLCPKHRRFRAQIGETMAQLVETDGPRDEYAVEYEIGAWS